MWAFGLTAEKQVVSEVQLKINAEKARLVQTENAEPLKINAYQLKIDAKNKLSKEENK